LANPCSADRASLALVSPSVRIAMSRRTCAAFCDWLICWMSCFDRSEISGSSIFAVRCSCGITPGPIAAIFFAASSRAAAFPAPIAAISFEMSAPAFGGCSSSSSPLVLTVTDFACQ
jgi:hypothetical protein